MNYSGKNVLADARTIIKQLIADSGKSVRAIALEAGMKQPALHKYLAGDTEELAAHNYVALALYFGVTVSQLIGETGLASDPQMRSMMRIMEQLPDDKRQALLAAGVAFAAQSDMGHDAGLTASTELRATPKHKVQ